MKQKSQSPISFRLSKKTKEYLRMKAMKENRSVSNLLESWILIIENNEFSFEKFFFNLKNTPNETR